MQVVRLTSLVFFSFTSLVSYMQDLSRLKEVLLLACMWANFQLQSTDKYLVMAVHNEFN